MGERDRISPIIWLLAAGLCTVCIAYAVRPIPRRAGYSPPTLWSRVSLPPPGARLLPEGSRGAARPEAHVSPPLYDEWFRDLSGPDTCGFDLDVQAGPAFELRLSRSETGLEPLLSTLDLMFVAWVSHRYQINPHFLLGIMDAESRGDCSAVSIAGAQGCFQITDSAGASQLRNSYPERMADWFWAPRRLSRTTARPWPPEGQLQDYYPADLFVQPSTHFEELMGPDGWTPALERRARRQLRWLLDPVATELRSDTWGDVQVSSVASFSFGAVGAALHLYWQEELLWAQALLEPQAREAFSVPGNKALWMATGYNQGGPRSTRILARSGAAFMSQTSAEVVAYARGVTSACLELEQGEPIGVVYVDWGQFSDFLQELRWTYSGLPVRWEPLRAELYRVWFMQGSMQLSRLPQVFDHMVHLEPNLAPEQPVLDFRLGWEGR